MEGGPSCRSSKRCRLLLPDGKVEEVGTHAELLEKKGEFHRLVEMQQEMSKIRAVAR